MATGGNKDQTLPTGRLAYGKASDGHFYPVTVDSDGNVQADMLVTKTIESELLAIQSVAASTQLKSSAISLSAGVKKATFFIDHGRTSSAAFGTQGTEYRIEASQKASGEDTWTPLVTILAESAACLAVAASADVAVGATTVVVTSGTSIPSLGDIVFWANSTAATASEWLKVITVTGTASFTILDGLTNAQDSDTDIFTKGERYSFVVDVEGITRIRAIVNNNNSGTTLAVYSRVAVITEK
jgi:hypothetical protein